MISLVKEQYCEDCPEFTPELKTDTVVAYENKIIDNKHYTHVVICKNYRICQSMVKYLKKHMPEKYVYDKLPTSLDERMDMI